MFAHAALALSSFLACLFGLRVFFSAIPMNLRTPAPVVGGPMFFDFDINLVWLVGYLQLLLVPVLSWFLYQALARSLKLKPAFKKALDKVSQKPTLLARVVPFLKVMAVGFFLGWIFYRRETTSLGVVSFGGAVVYAAVIFGAAWFLAQRSKRSEEWFRSALNLCFSSFTIFGLVQLSNQTAVSVDGVARPLSWFPLWAGLMVFVPLFVLCVYLCLSKPAEVTKREQLLLWWVLTPVALWGLDASVAGQIFLPGPDFFHLGEYFISSSLVHQGLVPWRDFLFVHGLLEDGLQFLPGLAAWGETVWAGFTGLGLWFHPLGLFLAAVLYLSLFRTNAAFLLVTLVWLLVPPLTIGGLAFVPRFLLVPASLTACLFYLKQPTPVRAIPFALLAAGSLFLTGELFFLAIGFAMVVLVSDVQAWNSRKSVLQRFPRTLWFGGLSLAVIGAGFLVLNHFGALAAFLDFHLKTASGHRFSGGMPVLLGTLESKQFGAGLPIQRVDMSWFYLNLLAVSTGLWYALSAWRNKRKLSPEELTMGALLIFGILYYQKFLSRADTPHFLMAWMPTIPLLFYILFRILNWSDGQVAKWRHASRFQRFSARPVSGLFAVLVVLSQLPMLSSRLGAERRLSATLGNNVIAPHIGPLSTTEAVASLSTDLRKFFKSNGTDSVFDFTNQPVLIHHLAGLKPAGRFPYVSVAIHPHLQGKVVEDLEKTRPRFVVYYSQRSPLFNWDGISNPVRHHRISRYLLENYEPAKWIGGNLVLERKSQRKGAKVSWDEAVESMSPCSWGFVPAYWSKGYSSAGGSASVRALAASRGPSGLETIVRLPRSSRGKSGRLEFYFSETDRDFIGLGVTGKPIDIAFATLPGKFRRYSVEVSSCPQWHARRTDEVTISHHKPLVIEKVEWTEY